MSDTNTKREDEIDKREEEMFNSHPDLRDIEERTGQASVGAGIDQAEAYANDPKNASSSNSLNQAEQQWHTDVGNNPKNSETKSRKTLIAKVVKRGGPAGLILTLLSVAGFSFFGPSTMLVNLISNLTNRYDYQSTSMSVRSQLMLANRLAGKDLTSGVCRSSVTIACRYSRPSNKLLNSLSDNGFTALDDKGKPIAKRLTGFPNAKPSSYEFTDSTGKKFTFKATELNNLIKSNPEISRGLANAYRYRYMGFSDKVATKIFDKFGVSKSDKLSKNTTADEATQKLNDESSPTSDSKTPADAAAIEAEVAAEVDAEINTGAKIAKKGDVIQMLGGGLCMLADTPSIFSKIERAYQMRYLIKYGLVFFAAADALKAGDATPEQVAAAGTILTATTAVGLKITNKSALDSFGIKYALFGDTSTKGTTQDYKKFIPGGGTTLGSIQNVTASPAVQNICNGIMSPQGTIGLQATEAGLAVASGGTVAILIKAAQVAIKGVAALGVIDAAVAISKSIGLTGAITSAITPFASKILSSIVKDWTKDIKGEDVGNAMTASMGALDGQIANAGGNMPLTQNQAVAYQGATNQLIAKESDVDRKTHSPFDASNPHTFLGTLATALLPSYGNFGSISGTITNMLSAPSLVSSLFNTKTYAATDNPQKYSLCQDSNIQVNKVAADPFCNIEYGIPVQYLNESPSDVLTAVSSQIDPDTGVPIAGQDLQNWIDQCGQGELHQSASCVITDKTHAEYALYLTDSRVLDGMDNPLPDPSNGTSGTASQAAGSVTVASYNFCQEQNNNCPVKANKAQDIASLVTSKGIDIVGAQEVSQQTQSGVLSNLPGYKSFPAQVPKSSGRAIIWNTTKLTDKTSGYLTGVYNNAGGMGEFPWVQFTTTDGRSIYFLDIHSPNNAHGSNVERRANAQKFLDWAKPRATGTNVVIITGDFNRSGNVDNGKPAGYCILTGDKTLQHAHDMQLGKNPATPCPSGPADAPFDQIYVSLNANVTASNWQWYGRNVNADIAGTDHGPALSTIAFPSSQTASAGGSGLVGNDYPSECKNYPVALGLSACPGQKYANECTSFVIFRLAKYHIRIPGALGNGGQVVGTLSKFYKTGNTPQANSVFSATYSDPNGHTGIVDKVNPDGSIVVEEYNFYPPHQYSSRTVSVAEQKAHGYTFAYIGKPI